MADDGQAGIAKRRKEITYNPVPRISAIERNNLLLALRGIGLALQNSQNLLAVGYRRPTLQSQFKRLPVLTQIHHLHLLLPETDLLRQIAGQRL